MRLSAKFSKMRLRAKTKIKNHHQKGDKTNRG
jgi:hypothetical protein